MKKIISGVLIISIFNLLIACSSSTLRIDKPPIGESVVITMIDGTTTEGVILKRVGEILKYIDYQTHRPEDLEIKKIKSLTYADNVYDLEGNVISEETISEQKSMSKTLAYGFGGFVLGAAVGFGVGALINSADESIPLGYPMAGLGIIGGIYFGIMGSNSDREDAIDDIRAERYEVSQAELRKKLEEEKQRLEQQKEKQEKMKEELKKKNEE